MKEIEKQIIGKWVDIKERARDIYALTEYFALPAAELEPELTKLASSVEEGIIEYKRTAMNLLFRSLENIKYKSLNMEVFEDLIRLLKLLIYFVLIQRLIAAGIVHLEKQKPGDNISADNIEINLILKDILARVKENPDFSKHTAVKNILVQFTIYKNERKTMEKLSPNVKDKSGAFYQNFKLTFQKIFASIRRNYEQILKEDAARFVKYNILTEIGDKQLTGLLFQQIRELSRILAILEYVYTEKYKIREILIRLYNSRLDIFKLIDAELKFYQRFCNTTGKPAKQVIEICNSFSREIVNVVRKQMD